MMEGRPPAPFRAFKSADDRADFWKQIIIGVSTAAATFLVLDKLKLFGKK
jgi:hypothetical protein